MNSSQQKIQNSDSKISLKTEWIKFCDSLLENINKIENNTKDKISQQRKNSFIGSDRVYLSKKLGLCKEFRIKIDKSKKEKEFELTDQDMEIINTKGYQHYFRTYQSL